nr:hypothetical protein 36 [Balneolaceae bacterium]
MPHRLDNAIEYARIIRTDKDLLRNRSKVPDHLYVVATATRSDEIGHVKIGITNNVKQRFLHIQAHSPVRCYLAFCANLGVSARAIEEIIHKELQTYKSHGEWFEISSKNAIACFKSACDKNEVTFTEIDLFSETAQKGSTYISMAQEEKRQKCKAEDMAKVGRLIKKIEI